RNSRIAWRKRYEKNRKHGFMISESLSDAQIREYRHFWKNFGRNVQIGTIQTCYSISNIYNKFIVPEEVFVSDIEPTLNFRRNISYIANKSFYNKWFPEGFFPKDCFHKVDGQLL